MEIRRGRSAKVAAHRMRSASARYELRSEAIIVAATPSTIFETKFELYHFDERLEYVTDKNNRNMIKLHDKRIFSMVQFKHVINITYYQTGRWGEELNFLPIIAPINRFVDMMRDDEIQIKNFYFLAKLPIPFRTRAMNGLELNGVMPN